MGKRRRPEPELPLFDLPLHSDGAAGDEEGTLDEPQSAEERARELLGDPDARARDLLGDIDDALQGDIDADGIDTLLESEDSDGDPYPADEVDGTILDQQDLDFDDDPVEAHTADGEFEEFDDLGPEEIASPVDRLVAGLADLGVHAAMLAVAAGSTMALGVSVGTGDWPPFAGLALVFSFLYWIIPLAFWGQTPGMAWIGNAARSNDDEPLSFGQALLRWFGALVTLVLVGLPLLLALGGRSLSDRLSDSKTLVI